MTARCHVDSCSVIWSETSDMSGPAYQADVNVDSSAPDVDATPTIQCGANGLEVMVSATAGNALSQTADGLAVLFPEATVETLSGNPDNNGVGPGADSGSPQSSDDYSWTNSTGRDALVLISGEFNWTYGIVGHLHTRGYGAGTGQRSSVFDSGAFAVSGVGDPAEPVLPFNAMLAMRLLANVDAPATTSRKATRVPVGGVIAVSDTDGAEQQTARVPFFWMVRVADGSTLNMKSQAFYEGPSQTLNIFSNHVGGTDGEGLVGTGHELWNLQVAAVPI